MAQKEKIVIEFKNKKNHQQILKLEEEFKELFKGKKTSNEIRISALTLGYKILVEELKDLNKERLYKIYKNKIN